MGTTKPTSEGVRQRRQGAGAFVRAATASVALGSFGCAPAGGASSPSTVVPLHLAPATDVVAAAGLVWMLAIRPRTIFEDSALIPALELVAPQARLDALAAR